MLLADALERRLDLGLGGAELVRELLGEVVAHLARLREIAADVLERGAQLGLVDAEAVGEPVQARTGRRASGACWAIAASSGVAGGDGRAVDGLGCRARRRPRRAPPRLRSRRRAFASDCHAASVPAAAEVKPKETRIRGIGRRRLPPAAVATFARWLSTPRSISSRSAPGRAAEPPARSRPGDAATTCAAAEGFSLWPGERATVPTGVAVALTARRAGLVVPRSGLAASHGDLAGQRPRPDRPELQRRAPRRARQPRRRALRGRAPATASRSSS